MDLRDWLGQVQEISELCEVRGADWDLEIGAITDLAAKHPNSKPAVLFDEIKGYLPGYRVLTGLINTAQRMSLTLRLPADLDDRRFVALWRKHLTTLQPVRPRFVSDGPVLENVLEGDAVDLLRFPVPRWNENDGGRYIGTANAVITRDPDTGWINVGTYRTMVHDARTAGLSISPGKHGRINQDKYLARGQACPVVIVCGAHPLIFLASVMPVVHRQDHFESELDWAGAVWGEPLAVVAGRYTGLPIPAHAEVVLEGEIVPGEGRVEGPFAEWTGYYASGARPLPITRIQAIYHRRDPILTGVVHTRIPSDFIHAYELMRAAQLWNELEAAGLSGVTGVACHQQRFITTVSIDQRYAGQAKQAALLAAGCHASAYLGRYIIIVDDDVDVYDLNSVIWALATRVDPRKDIDIVRNCWSGPLDPVIPLAEKGFNSRALIDATKPFKWREQFPTATQVNPEVIARVKQNWGHLPFLR